MKIQNVEILAVTDARRSLLAIAEAGLAAIDTDKIVRETLKINGNTLAVGNEKMDLKEAGKILFIGIGKCAADAAYATEQILGDRLSGGVIVDVKVCPDVKRLKAFCGTHPLPSEENLLAAEAIVGTLKGLTENDVVIFVVSGGGSTLLFLPEDKTNREEIPVFKALMHAGAAIRDMNVVRKHMSLARGGYLAKYAYPARVVSLIFSDVPGDDISSISSGPTTKDMTTIEDAERILAKFDVLRTCNIEKCGLVETPKEDKYFEKVSNIVAVSNKRALEAIKQAAEGLGFRAAIRDTELSGEAKEVAHMVVNAIHGEPPRSVLLWGGETTVTVRGKGSGGRNLELCASALPLVKDGEAILSLASDGRDHGPFAGAICDKITMKAIADAGLDLEAFLRENNEYPLFEKVGNYLMTGDTGSNVSDLVIALKI